MKCSDEQIVCTGTLEPTTVQTTHLHVSYGLFRALWFSFQFMNNSWFCYVSGPDAGLLLQPFRKPKRIRTAFSPAQLLRLEHAFEKNHYVVGQERKELASSLNLTETQVIVNFKIVNTGKKAEN